jgi:hypothetical protein
VPLPKPAEPQIILSTKVNKSLADEIRRRAQADRRNICNFLALTLERQFATDTSAAEDVQSTSADVQQAVR